VLLGAATVALVVVGTLWPVPSAAAYAGEGASLLHSWSTPEAAVRTLANDIGHQNLEAAYASLGNKGQFSEAEFVRDLRGSHPSLRTYATLETFQLRPLHATAEQAEIQLELHWSTVVGPFRDIRTLQVVRNGNRWEPLWPLVKEPRVPPQVMAVNYLRWDVIYPGPGDDWGVQGVEPPHVRIVDMHPVERAAGVVVLGELLNEDVVPAWVSVRATLQAKNGSAIATEGSFDKISHLLLPKQVTPFLILFPNTTLSEVASIRMDPVATLVSASADPVIEIQGQQLHPVPDPSLTGTLVDQSGEVANVAHVLATFYDKSGQLVWVADRYVDRALLPQSPVPFTIPIPEDLAGKVSTERAVVATYTGGFE
jgi:hypothetical protein